MSRISKQTQNAILLLGMLVLSFALYAGAESGSEAAMIAILTLLSGLMAMAILKG